jgi:hypothetical protein
VTFRLYSLCVVCAIATLALFTMGAAPRPRTVSGVVAGDFPCATASCTAVASWKHGRNWRPSTDSIRVVWRDAASSLLRRQFTRGTADTLTVPAPALGSPLTGTVAVCVFRAGFVEPACAAPVAFSIETQDSPPDAPDSVIVTPAQAALMPADTLRFQAVVFSR